MAETEIDNEELLDFDGSDYEFGSMEEDHIDRNEEQVKNRDLPQQESGEIYDLKTDLEDGEFFDASPMVSSKKQCEHGAVKDVKRKHSDFTHENGHDRKRREYEYDYERHHGRGRKEPYDRRNERSDRDRRHNRFSDIPDRPRGPRSTHTHTRPNLASPIGSGRPFRPNIRPSTAGLEIFSPAQLQELLNQEHMLRSQQMLLRLGVRPQPVYPLVGANFLRPPLPGSELLPFMGSLDPRIPGRGPGMFGGMFGLRPNINTLSRPLSSAAEFRSDRHSAQQGKNEGKSGGNAGNKHGGRHRQDSAQPRRRDDKQRQPAESGNMIQLGGPVQKSRVLTVSGFLENTPVSTVADAFEKQGKILDLRKNAKGDVFTITFSTVQEALSAKRHLHRSLIAGRQITVEYAV